MSQLRFLPSVAKYKVERSEKTVKKKLNAYMLPLSKIAKKYKEMKEAEKEEEAEVLFLLGKKYSNS